MTTMNKKRLAASTPAIFALCLLLTEPAVQGYMLGNNPPNSDKRQSERLPTKISKVDQSQTRLIIPPAEPTMLAEPRLTSRSSTKRNVGGSSYPSASYGYGRYSYIPSVAVDAEIEGDNGGERVGLFSRWKDRIAKVSNIASLLCVVDCTVLPIITIIFPLIGLAASPSQMNWIHALGHSVAMNFVIPVGGFAAFMNYLSHKRPLLSLPAAIGLSLIYLANGHGGPILSMIPHHLMHTLHCGTLLHRVTNIAGCALLMGSNYVSHRAGCSHETGKSCGRFDCRGEGDFFFKWDK